MLKYCFSQITFFTQNQYIFFSDANAENEVPSDHHPMSEGEQSESNEDGPSERGHVLLQER